MELTAETIQTKLPEYRVHYYERVDSTNDAALDALANSHDNGWGAPIRDVFIADEQIKGKGRLGRTWYTAPGTALIVSIILPLRQAKLLPRVTMLGAVAIAEMIEHVRGVQVSIPDVGIKWPNDVQVSSKKVSGVLAEAYWLPEHGNQYLKGLVLGMGVNVRTDFTGTELGKTAISIEPALGKPVDRSELLIDLVKRVDKWYQKIGSPELFEAWKSRLNMLGKVITVQQGAIKCVAERVDDQGALWVRDESGMVQRVIAGDIGLG
jgi:BirA family biotin operon repressor/biotin-[acetyl-CoA-carboxylase] ligase